MANIVNTITEGWIRAIRVNQQAADSFDNRRSDDEIREIDWLYNLGTVESGSGFKLNNTFSGDRTYLRQLGDNDSDNILRVIGRVIDCDNPVSITISIRNSSGDFVAVEGFNIAADGGFDMHNPTDLQLLAEVNIGKYMREGYQPLIFMGDSSSAIGGDIFITSSSTDLKIDAIEMMDITSSGEEDEDEDRNPLTEAESSLIIREMLADVYNTQTLLKSILTDISNDIAVVNSEVNNNTRDIAKIQADISKLAQSITTITSVVSATDGKCNIIGVINDSIQRLNTDSTSNVTITAELNTKMANILDIVNHIDSGDVDVEQEIVESTGYKLTPGLCCVITCAVVAVTSFISYNRNK